MRTTVDIPANLLKDAMAFSGARTKREAIRWALEVSLRRKAGDDLIALRGKVKFDFTPEELNRREIRGRRKRARFLGRR